MHYNTCHMHCLTMHQNTVHYHYIYTHIVRHLLMPLPIAVAAVYLFLLMCCCCHWQYLCTHTPTHTECTVIQNRARALYNSGTYTHLWRHQIVNVCSVTVSYKVAPLARDVYATNVYILCVKKCVLRVRVVNEWVNLFSNRIAYWMFAFLYTSVWVYFYFKSITWRYMYMHLHRWFDCVYVRNKNEYLYIHCVRIVHIYTRPSFYFNVCIGSFHS